MRHAKSDRDDAQSTLDSALEDLSQSESGLKQAIHAYLQANAMWRRDADELTMLEADEIAEMVVLWSEESEAANPLSIRLSAAAVQAKENLGREQAAVKQRQREMVAEHREVSQRLESLEHGYHEPPAPLPATESMVAKIQRVCHFDR